MLKYFHTNMDIPVQIAIRLKPPSLADSTQCIFSNPVTQIVVTESGQTFHVNRALPVDCTQANLFNSFMIPQINCFLDGCDTSVVVFGQAKTGKTYTLFGSGVKNILIINFNNIIVLSLQNLLTDIIFLHILSSKICFRF